MIFWDFIVATTFIVSFFLTPLNMALLFQPYWEEFRSIELVIDFVIIFDILVNFMSETIKDVEVFILGRRGFSVPKNLLRN